MKYKKYICLCLILFSSFSLYASQKGIFVLQNKHHIQIDIAISQKEQEKGLGGRTKLAYGQGMLFPYHQADEHIFWMKGMLIPIDIIWIYKNKVVHIEKNILPPKKKEHISDLPLYGTGVMADSILEVPAGYSDSIDLKISDSAKGDM